MSDTRQPRLSELDQCPCAGRNLGKLLQPAVLAVLAGGTLHGYRIVQRLAEMSMFRGRQPDNTGVYRFLKAMQDRRLVTSAWDTSDSGPARRLFTLSGKGRECLARWAATLEEYHGQLGQLLRRLKLAERTHSPPPCGCPTARPAGKASGRSRRQAVVKVR